ncbi:hypothetical protein C6P45_003217 [Maudiozyma exigua]|uniref:Uncharacterized protein n=1 Tax=Maudiozyma exigua TaxID=34358 RepID=A0A9P7B2I0_MAUEX|nr:hypothetical protein C6P45_003217 [Kazachstania exigua]
MNEREHFSKLNGTIRRYKNEIIKITEGDLLLRDDCNTYISTIDNAHSDIFEVLSNDTIAYFQIGECLDSNVVSSNQPSPSTNFNNVWTMVQKPLFSWFQIWKQSLPRYTRNGKKFTVERRKMLRKLKRVFKIMHRFYYSFIEMMFVSFNIESIVPKRMKETLNISKPPNPDCKILKKSDSDSYLIVELLYECLFYLGKVHYWEVLLETREGNLTVENFNKSRRYLDIGCILCESYGKTYSQVALICLKTGDKFETLYYSLRGLGTRIRHKNSICVFDGIMRVNKREVTKLDIEDISRIQVKDAFLHVLKHSYNAVSPTPSIIHKIMDFFFTKDKLLSHNYSSELLSKMVIILIGCVHEFVTKHEDGKGEIEKLIWVKSKKRYLKWTFSLIKNIFSSIMEQNWIEKFNNSHCSLGIIRLIMCWIKSNKFLLQYLHRDASFCKLLADSVNRFRDCNIFGTNLYTEHRPKRSYLFPDDIQFKGYLHIQYMLSDFNDNDIFESGDTMAILLGDTDSVLKLSAYSENLLRLTAIILSITKFLHNNKFDIRWDVKSRQFQFNTTIFKSIEEPKGQQLDKTIEEYQKHKRKYQRAGNPNNSINLNDLTERLSPRKRRGHEKVKHIRGLPPPQNNIESPISIPVQDSTEKEYPCASQDILGDSLFTQAEESLSNVVISPENSTSP